MFYHIQNFDIKLSILKILIRLQLNYKKFIFNNSNINKNLKNILLYKLILFLLFKFTQLYNYISNFCNYLIIIVKAIIISYYKFYTIDKIYNLIFQLLNNDFFEYKNYN